MRNGLEWTVIVAGVVIAVLAGIILDWFRAQPVLGSSYCAAWRQGFRGIENANACCPNACAVTLTPSAPGYVLFPRNCYPYAAVAYNDGAPTPTYRATIRVGTEAIPAQ